MVLGSHPGFGEVMRSLYQLVFRLAAQTLRAKEDLPQQPPERATAYSWIFFDELRSAGKFDGLPELLLEGRSKGVSLALGFQDIPGLTHVYGEELAQEIVGICANRLFLYMADPTSIQFASDSLGKVKKRVHTISINQSFGKENSTSKEMSAEDIEDALVPPSKFSEIRRPVAGRIGISGYAQTERIGIHKVELTPEFLKKALDPYTTEESKNEPGLKSIDADDEYLDDWTLQELMGRLRLAKIANKLLGIPEPEEKEASPPPDQDPDEYGILGQVSHSS